jgi:hypothetical protein
MGFLTALQPSTALHQAKRLLWPHANIPPLTNTTITLDPNDIEVRFGDDVVIAAQASGEPVDRMQLVLQRQDGTEQTLPMLRQSDQRFQVILSRATESLEYVARSGRNRSTAGTLRVRLTPEIVSSEVQIVPPEYTHRAVYRGKIPKDGIQGLRDTQVTFNVKSNRPLANGTGLITYRDGSSESFALAPIPDAADSDLAAVRGTIALSKPGKFRIQVIDHNGEESKDSLEGSIQITLDQRPILRIVEPRPISMATPDIELPVQILAEDDYGISSLRLYRSLNGSNATLEAFAVDGGPRQLIETRLPLMHYQLHAGDELHFFARTEDNDPAGPKGAETPITRVEIISVEEFQEILVQQEGAASLSAKYEAAQRHMENLAEAVRDAMQRAESESNSKQEIDAANEALDQAIRAAEEAAKQIERLADQAMPIDVDQSLSEELRKTADEMKQIAEQLKEIREDVERNQEVPNEERRQEMQEMLNKIQSNRDEIQDQAIDPLAVMQATLPLMDDQERFEELAEKQRDLANRIASAQNEGTKDKEQLARRIAELESQQESLKRDLEDLLEDIEAHAEDLPREPDLDQLRDTARKFAEQLRAADASKPMADAQKRLLEDRLADATQQASEAAVRLEELMKDSKENNMGEAGEKACKAAFDPKRNRPDLGRSLNQLRKMMQQRASGKDGSRPGTRQGDQGGFSQKSGAKKNLGMYGNMPEKRQNKEGGRGDKKTRGSQSNASNESVGKGAAIPEANQSNQASGQAVNAIPSQYRSKVAEYYRRVTEQLGEQEEGNRP